MLWSTGKQGQGGGLFYPGWSGHLKLLGDCTQAEGTAGAEPTGTRAPWVPGPQGEGSGDDKVEAGGTGKARPTESPAQGERAQTRQELQVSSRLSLIGPPV